jgi:putative transposase
MKKGPKPADLTLQDEERKELETFVRRYNTPQQLAKRARMILGAAEGKRNAEIGREVGACTDTVRSWRMRWISLQSVPVSDLSIEERLEDLARPGKPSHITAEQQCQIVALACEQPKERPISHWTGPEVADEIMKRGIVTQISPRHATRLLKKGISNPI